MKKKDFVTLMIGMIGTLVFGLGMCMCLIAEWNAFKSGVAVTAVGAMVLLVLALVRWMQAGRPVLHVNGKIAARAAVAIAGALTLGIGMCMVLVWQMFIPGIVVGLIGIVLLMLLIPMIAGLK